MERTLIEVVIAEDVEAVKDLLEQGADPNQAEDKDKITPLHFVAQKKSQKALQIAQLLVCAGADPLAQNESDKQTPLEIAHWMSSEAMIAILSNTDEQQVWQ